MGRRQQEHRRKLRQLLARLRPPRAVNHYQGMGLRWQPVDRVRRAWIACCRRRRHVPRHARTCRKSREGDPLRVNSEFFCPRPHNAHRPVAVQRPCGLVVSRTQPVGQNKSCRAPVVKSLGDIHTFEVVHQHDVRTSRGDYHRRPVRLPRWPEDRQKRRIQWPIA